MACALPRLPFRSARTMEFRVRIRYRFGDIDHAGIAYFPRLLHCFHAAMEDWWADGIGTPYPEILAREGFGLPIAHLEAGFAEPVRYGDEPWIHLGVLGIGTSSLRLGFHMSRDEHGPALCWARIRLVCVAMDSRRPMPIPDRWRAAFESFAIREGDFPATAESS